MISGIEIACISVMTGVFIINSFYAYLLVKECREKEEQTKDLLDNVIYPLHFRGGYSRQFAVIKDPNI